MNSNHAMRMSVFFGILFVLANSSWATVISGLSTDKALLRDRKLESAIADYHEKLKASDEGLWLVEDRRRYKIPCAANCACTANKIKENVISGFGYKVSMLKLLPIYFGKGVIVLDGTQRTYDYHVALLVADDHRAMVIDPVVLFHTRPVALKDWLKLFDNVYVTQFEF